MPHNLLADQQGQPLDEVAAERIAELERQVDGLRAKAAAKTVLLHEVDHRVKNNLQVIGALIRMHAKAAVHEEAARALASVLSRVEAVATVHRRLYQGADVGRFDVAAFARDLAADRISAARRADLRLELDLVSVEIDKDKAAPLALVVNELVTNTIQHAFKERGGRLLVRVRPEDRDLVVGIEDDGVGLPGQELGQGSLGRAIVDLLASQLQAQVRWEAGQPGTRVTVRMPLAFAQAGPAA